MLKENNKILKTKEFRYSLINTLSFLFTDICKLLFMLASGLILANVDNSFMFLSIASTIFYISCVFPIIFAYKDLKNRYNNIDKNSARPQIDLLFVLFHITFGLFQPIMDNVVPLYLYVNNF